jgi:hypothetical protein
MVTLHRSDLRGRAQAAGADVDAIETTTTSCNATAQDLGSNFTPDDRACVLGVLNKLQLLLSASTPPPGSSNSSSPPSIQPPATRPPSPSTSPPGTTPATSAAGCFRMGVLSVAVAVLGAALLALLGAS